VLGGLIFWNVTQSAMRRIALAVRAEEWEGPVFGTSAELGIPLFPEGLVAHQSVTGMEQNETRYWQSYDMRGLAKQGQVG
jgi:hypothetical protein